MRLFFVRYLMSQDRDLNPGPMRYECIALPTELSWHWYKRLFVGLCVEFIRLMAEVIALPTELSSWLNLKQEEYTGNRSFFQAQPPPSHGV